MGTEYICLQTSRLKTLKKLIRPYKGPYKVISRGPESFVLEVSGKQDKLLIHRLIPYFFQEDPQPSSPPSRWGRPPWPLQLQQEVFFQWTPTSPPAFDLEADFPIVRSLPDWPVRAHWRKVIGPNYFEEASTGFQPKLKSLSSIVIFFLYVDNFLYSFVLNYEKNIVSFRGGVELPTSVWGVCCLSVTYFLICWP